MTDYKFLFGSLGTEQIIAEIPLFGTYMDLEMNVGGRFDGSFSLDQTGKDNDTLVSATIPGRSFVAVERDGKCIWIGYVWSRTYQSQSKSVQMYGQSFEYFPSHQLIRSDTLYTTTEQLEIFKGLWNEMQAVPGRNMNINIPTVVAPTLVPKTVDMKATDFKYYSEIMSSLADGDNGFDWTIDVTKSGSQYIKTLRYVYPVMGATDAGLTNFEYPGSILNYYATESMADAGTNVFSLGAGSGSEMLVYEHVHADLLTSGFPRWDFIVAAKDIDDQAALDQIGIAEGGIARPPRMVIKPTFKAEQTPAFGDWGMGDAARLVIKDPRFPTGINFDTRIVKWALQPGSAENSDEYQLIFAGDEENA
jgi:hypothetical protein